MIQFSEVTKTYPNGVSALRGVDLTIQQGEFVAIIGLSGAGKSTLLRTINQMIKISTGTLIVNEVDVTKLKGKQLRRFRRGIGMVFQSFNLIKRTTVIKNVLSARVADMHFYKRLLGLYSTKDRMIALEALDNVGILEKAYTREDQLSGGQQHRVALARCLAQEPQIILADEPVASLDPVTSHQVMNDFVQVNKALNITVIVNMHHVDIALKYANRVIGIKEGLIVFDGPSKDITEERLTEIYGRELSDDDLMGEE